jgi:hypothetical protein
MKPIKPQFIGPVMDQEQLWLAAIHHSLQTTQGEPQVPAESE